jgi:hypothetical protein
MTFQPVVPMSGYSGWLFLQRTIDQQQTLHAASAPIVRDTEYFRENIGTIRTAEDLVADRRLLSVALGAFGLGDDIDNKFFIRKVLEEGTASSDALANKLSDKSYRSISDAFGFGTGQPPNTGLPAFANNIIEAYEQKQFEIGVGQQDETFRIALNAQSELSELAAGSLSAKGKWYSVLGSTPLRMLFETALGLPETVAQLDLDVQVEMFRTKSSSVFGSDQVSAFADPEDLDNLIKTYLLRAEIDDLGSGMSSADVALSLLGG